MMDKEFVKSYLDGNHYLRTGIFFLGALLSFCALIKPWGNYRYAFLFFLLFLPMLVFEFIHYYRVTHEIQKDLCVTARMRVGRISIIEMKKEKVGLQLEGLIGKKVYVLKYYTMEKIHEKMMNNLSRYKEIDVVYYPLSDFIKEMHPVYGEEK